MKAIAWLSLAADQGYTSAVENKGVLPQKLTSEQLGEAREFVAKLRERMTAEQVAEAQELTAKLRERIESSKSE